MKTTLTSLAVATEICVGIFCLIIYGRFSPIADKVLEQFKIPVAMVPPMLPHLIGLAGCIMIVSLAFKLTLPAKDH